VLGGAIAGVSILELAFNRAAWARALAPTAFGPKLFDIHRIADGVFHAIARPRRMINSSSVIFVGKRDVLVVDAQAQPSVTAALINEIKKELTPKPVRYVVNTHFHDDHIQGNSAYRSGGGPVDFIAHTATKELMAQEARPRLQAVLEKAVPSQYEKLRELLAQAKTAEEKAFWEDQERQLRAYEAEMKSFSLELPTITLDRSHVVKDGVHDLHIEFHGKAHTAGDVVVFCPQKRVVAAGDMILGGIPYMPDSYPKAWPRTIDSVAALEFDSVLAAHGPRLDRKRVINQRDFMDEVNERVEAAKKAGLSREETRKAITVESLKSLQADGYGEFMFGVRDSLFPHWGQTFLGQPPDPQGSLSGMVGTTYRRFEET
jgi:glyoxylase-like metal-dependent hydrolase (beta-lactamase superfamily II)